MTPQLRDFVSTFNKKPKQPKKAKTYYQNLANRLKDGGKKF